MIEVDQDVEVIGQHRGEERVALGQSPDAPEQERLGEPGRIRIRGGSTAQVEHEATTTKIGEDQIFYCNQRGLDMEEAVSMIVNGFCKEVFRELPMEFAVEAQKLLGISLEGSVG